MKYGCEKQTDGSCSQPQHSSHKQIAYIVKRKKKASECVRHCDAEEALLRQAITACQSRNIRHTTHHNSPKSSYICTHAMGGTVV